MLTLQVLNFGSFLFVKYLNTFNEACVQVHFYSQNNLYVFIIKHHMKDQSGRWTVTLGFCSLFFFPMNFNFNFIVITVVHNVT